MNVQLADVAKVKFSPVDADLVDLLSFARWEELWNALAIARQMCRFGKKETTANMRLLIEDGTSPVDILEPFDNAIVTLENALIFMKAAQARAPGAGASIVRRHELAHLRSHSDQ